MCMREREKDEAVIADHNPNGHNGQTSCTFLFVSGHQLEGGEVAEEGNRLPGHHQYCNCHNFHGYHHRHRHDRHGHHHCHHQ